MLATRTATLQATKRALTLAPRSQLVSARAPAAAATRVGRLTTKTPVLPVNGARSFHAACRTCQEQLVKVPSMAESITEGTLKQWLKQKGDFVEADEEVATIETDKIDVAVNAPSAGVLTDLLAQEEDTVTVGQDLFKLDTSASKPEGGAAPKEESQPKEEKKEESKPKEEEPKPKQEEEAKPEPKSEYRKPDSSQPAPKPVEQSKRDSSSSAEQPAPGKFSRNETKVKISRMRARIAERLKEAQNTAASLTTFNEIDMSNLMAFRAKYKDQVMKDHGVKLGFMSAFVKASTVAMKELPAVNASIVGEGTSAEIVYRDYVDVSVAVSTPKGLVTPVLRNAESYDFIGIEREIANLGKKARDGKLTLEDMTGGSFTISNGGVFGSLFGTPILNTPQTAVLGMHATKDKPWVVDNQVVIRPIMVVALTYDHRLLDGREAVTFLVRLKQLIEDPALFALHCA
ncbi:dihydrolipoyllysine-residue succinyltransferase component of 2-oxoglutarate dehydrogenase-like protein complex [Rhodotorula sp. JG-1b]|nr:dihydrolipoyllysine-residue succinyltransferase component of 2-oxoglutarate dehydrogenase-like protein complex [Rhodotorula sp. JG-1b]